MGGYCPDCGNVLCLCDMLEETNREPQEYPQEYLDENGQLHRTDGPAVKWRAGDRFWYCHGLLHREGGPAIEWANGQRDWWRNGQRHRDDGPAIERPNGGKEEWWQN